MGSFRYYNEETGQFDKLSYTTVAREGNLKVVVLNEGENQSVTIDGDFYTMQIITSVQDDELKEVYNGEFKNQIEIGSDSIVTVVVE